MLSSATVDQDIEAEADEFASYLLMPLTDFRAQVKSKVDLDVLGHCAERYGVSLTAAILKWLSYTDEKAIVVMSRDMVFARTAGTTPSGDETLSTAVIRAIPGRILKAILQRAERRQSRQNLRRRSDIPVTS